MLVFAATGSILALWVVVGAACLGWGAGLVRILTREASVRLSAPELFWAGFSLLIGLLQVWHLLLPVDWRATVFLLGGGVAAGFGTGVFRSFFTQKAPAIQVVIILVAAFWLAYRGLDFPRNYDSSLYHFSTIRWINEFSVVPGLANLHDRFGFNQSYFLFVALLNVHPFFGQGYHAANSLLSFVLVAMLLATALTTVRAERRARIATMLECSLLPIVVAQSLRGDVSSPTPDFAVFIVGLAAFVMLIRLAEGAAVDGLLRRDSSVMLTALLAAGCTLKLNFSIFALAVMGLMLLGDRGKRPSGISSGRKWLVWLLAGCGLFWGVPFVIHGIILSGYPLFPSTILAWPGDWRLPVAAVEECANWIRSWARQPGARMESVLGSWTWLGPWWQRTRLLPGVYLPLVVAAGSSLLLVATGLRDRSRRTELVRWLIFLTPILAGLVFWFFTAPDPRFADWLLWLLAAWLCACTIRFAQAVGKILPPRVLALVTLGAVLGVALIGIPAWLPARQHGFNPLPQAELREFFTRSGLKVYVPVSKREVQLWDAPLPAAPQANPRLELRGSNLGDGFRTSALPPKAN